MKLCNGFTVALICAICSYLVSSGSGVVCVDGGDQNRVQSPGVGGAAAAAAAAAELLEIGEDGREQGRQLREPALSQLGERKEEYHQDGGEPTGARRMPVPDDEDERDASDANATRQQDSDGGAVAQQRVNASGASFDTTAQLQAGDTALQKEVDSDDEDGGAKGDGSGMTAGELPPLAEEQQLWHDSRSREGEAEDGVVPQNPPSVDKVQSHNIEQGGGNGKMTGDQLLSLILPDSMTTESSSEVLVDIGDALDQSEMSRQWEREKEMLIKLSKTQVSRARRNALLSAIFGSALALAALIGAAYYARKRRLRNRRGSDHHGPM